MENQLVEAVNYIKKISKKKPSINRLLAHISNATGNNWNRKSVEDTLCVLRAKGVIDKPLKSLLADNTITPSNYKTTLLPGHPLTPKSANLASTQTQTTPASPVSSD